MKSTSFRMRSELYVRIGFILMVILSVLTKIQANQWPQNSQSYYALFVMWLYSIFFPMFAGYIVRFVLVEFDKFYKHDEDFPTWLYYVMATLIGLVLSGLFLSNLPQVLNNIWFDSLAKFLLYVLIYFFGFTNHRISIRPSSTGGK